MQVLQARVEQMYAYLATFRKKSGQIFANFKAGDRSRAMGSAKACQGQDFTTTLEMFELPPFLGTNSPEAFTCLKTPAPWWGLPEGMVTDHISDQSPGRALQNPLEMLNYHHQQVPLDLRNSTAKRI